MKRYVFLAIIAVLLLAPMESNAVPRAGTRAGLWTVNLDTTLFGFGTGRINHKDANRADDDFEFDAVTGGIGMGNAAIGAGYTLIDGLVLGVRVRLGAQGLDEYRIDDTAFVWSFVPYVEYIFLDGLWRPFVTGKLGFDGKVNDDLWYWGCTIGVGGGVHAFIFNNFSADARFLFDINFGSGEFGSGEARQWRFGMGGMVGMSVWF
ncbi:MAG: hypothetical protein GY762_17700 [Proteobacteria bacterium]|nr:hypothetical protein [Pseudomonadota bacterium]